MRSEVKHLNFYKCKFASIVMLALLFFSLFFTTVSLADVNFSVGRDQLRQASVFGSKVSSTKSGSGVDFTSQNILIDKAGFDAVYGTDYRKTKYSGEVPKSSKLSDEKPILNAEKLNGLERTWTRDPGKLGLSWDDDSNITDLHAKPLLKEAQIFDDLSIGLIDFLPMLLNFAISLATWANDLLITLANFDPIELVSIITGRPEFYNDITRIIIGGKGSMSPVFVVSIAAFLIGFFVSCIKYFASGGSSISEIKEDALVFFLALIIAGVGLVPGGGTQITKMMNTTSKFLSDAVSSINTEAKDKSYFSWSTSDESSKTFASTKTQQSLLRKSIIDSNISTQFGVPVEELKLEPETWGISQQDFDSIISNLCSNDKDDVFKFSTSPDGTLDSSQGNLGYYWYAASSDVDIKNPFSQGKDKSVTKNTTASNDPVLFVIDFVSAVAAKDGSDYQKCDTIINNFTRGGSQNPVHLLMIVAIQVAVACSLVFPALFTLINKAIFSIGFLVLPVIPIALLVKQFRDFAKKAVMTWINGAFKAIILQTIVLFIVYIPATMLSNFDFTGFAMSLVMLIGIIAFGPKVCTIVQQDIGFRDTIDRNLNSRVSNFTNRFSPHSGKPKDNIKFARDVMGKAEEALSFFKGGKPADYSSEESLSPLSNVGNAVEKEGAAEQSELIGLRADYESSEEHKGIAASREEKASELEDKSDYEALESVMLPGERLSNKERELIEGREGILRKAKEDLESTTHLEKLKEAVFNSKTLAKIPFANRNYGYKAKTKAQQISELSNKQNRLDNNTIRSAISKIPPFALGFAATDSVRAAKMAYLSRKSVKANKAIGKIDESLALSSVRVRKVDEHGREYETRERVSDALRGARKTLANEIDSEYKQEDSKGFKRYLKISFGGKDGKADTTTTQPTSTDRDKLKESVEAAKIPEDKESQSEKSNLITISKKSKDDDKNVEGEESAEAANED